MAQQRTAILKRSAYLGEGTRLLSFRMTDDGVLGFVGGQYIIVDTGILIAGNKVAKRAYSIISADQEQHEFQLAVRRIGEGPGSNYMHCLAPGAEMKFSGPWGKFVADDRVDSGRLVFATDTGITAALGLLRSRATANWGGGLKLIWFAQSDSYFLPFHTVMGALDRTGVRNIAIVGAPAPANPDRIRKALGFVGHAIATEPPASAFLSGDGDVIRPISELLVGAGLQSESIRSEYFFNSPQRKSRLERERDGNFRRQQWR
jgi:ferredoxin-NADP reductase